MGLGDRDSLVTDQSGHSVAATILSPVPVGHAEGRRSLLPSAALAGGELIDDLLNGLVQSLLEDSEVGSVPRTEKSVRVRAETGLVQQGGGEVVPGNKRTTVDTDDLVVREPIVLVLGLEPLHAQQVQVPLVGILLQRADLQARGRDTAVVVAGAVAVGVCAANTSDGSVTIVLTSNQAVSNLVDLALEDGVLRMTGVVVMASVLESDCELKESKEGEQHGGHVRGLAEVGHSEMMLCSACASGKNGQGKKSRNRLRCD